MNRKRPDPRPEIGALRPYRPAAKLPEVRLHANENPFPLPAEVMDEIAAAVRELPLNRYPDPEATELRAELGAYVGLDPAWIWPGTGSNEILLNACLAYGGPGRTALLFTPTYAMHRLQATIAGLTVRTVARRDNFTLDIDAALSAISELAPEIVFVCTPDNPTGVLTFPEDIVRIADVAPGLVIVDEAYHEFAGVTLADRLDDYGNVIVVRTMSKAFGMAGARMGYALAQPDTLEPLVAVRMPYGQSALNQAAAVVALRHRDKILEAVQLLVGERDRVIEALRKMDGVTVFPSLANFVLFRPPDAASMLAGLADRGVAVRDMSHIEGCEGCLRVTTGTPDENDRFLQAGAELV
jgi:histidinol-phosphate aminotransferase